MSKNAIPTLSVLNILGEQTFGITLFRHSVKGRNEFEQPHKHDFYLVFFVENGSGFHSVDFKQTRVEDYQIHFVGAGQVHNWSLDVNTNGFQLMISPAIMTVFSNLSQLPFFGQSSPFCLSLDKNGFQNVKSQLEEIESDLVKDDLLTKEIVLLRLHLLFKLLQKEYVSQFPDNDVAAKSEKIIKKFKTLIEDHFTTQFSVNFYAGELNVTSNYLNILSQKFLNKSAGDVIKERTILEAKRLLISTDLSVKEIAYQLGFSDNGYFAKVFKKYIGITPTDFKENYNLYHSYH